MLSSTFASFPHPRTSPRWLVIVRLTLHNHGFFCSLTQIPPLRSYMRLILFHGLTRTSQRFGNSSRKGEDRLSAFVKISVCAYSFFTNLLQLDSNQITPDSGDFRSNPFHFVSFSASLVRGSHFAASVPTAVLYLQLSRHLPHQGTVEESQFLFRLPLRKPNIPAATVKSEA